MLEMKKNNKRPTGTREWAAQNWNIGSGCSHGCIYCYARQNAVRFRRIQSIDEWRQEKVSEHKTNKKWGKRDGTITFPTTHDISPYYLKPYIHTLVQMLKAGNKVLIVSKPHLKCIKKICAATGRWKDQILFRFTIGSLNMGICKLWEPYAPSPMERVKSLKYAFKKGFKTSVSVEPMLGGSKEAIEVYDFVVPYVTDNIWFGKMNYINSRVIQVSNKIRDAVRTIKIQQTDKEIKILYKIMKDKPHIRWKDSIKQIMGIKPSAAVGMDV